ncbi:MAG: Holliday junction branch migration protein RuvA [Patescibacteria group bacterium]
MLEDQLSLYGFSNQDELRFFQKLISISGVGPRMALSILNAGPVQQLQKAIAGGDLAILTTISGVGKKTAERILVELKNQIDVSLDGDSSSDSEDLLAALTQLGYNAYEVRRICHGNPSRSFYRRPHQICTSASIEITKYY